MSITHMISCVNNQTVSTAPISIKSSAEFLSMEQLVLIGLITGIVLLGMAILAVAVLISSRKCSQRTKCKNDNSDVQEPADGKYSRPHATSGKSQKSGAKMCTDNKIRKSRNTIEEVSSTASRYSVSHIYDNDSSSLQAPTSGESSLQDVNIRSEKNIQREISFLTDSFPSETGNQLLLIEAEVYGRPVSEQIISEAVRESLIYLKTLHISISQDISSSNKSLRRKKETIIPVEERATVELRESVCTAEDIRGNRDVQEEVKSFSRDSAYDNNWDNRFSTYDNHFEHLPRPESGFVEFGLQNIMRISETKVKALYASNSKSMEVPPSENDIHLQLIDTGVYVEPDNAKSSPGLFKDREDIGDKDNPGSNYANVYEDKHGYLVPNTKF
ncbi:hypothetical protein Bpfe_021951 [Biomphalaria pfeifferi]|uniref:Uncharacterized protein n=1 Tax=Biomphalaria pfeifferi TaxID=112525 RepID=A0AAD8B650_BIOPF|nr:hypothetical protein Bpfe_021951 [Biomphalaria pfeifferi]